MIREAVILAGGFGTRLRSVVSDVPKCMAPVSGVPFLKYIIDPLIKQGINRIIFSVGYKSEVIADFLLENYKHFDYVLAQEAEPLGTGGAIKLACSFARDPNIIVLNGDTFFNVDIGELNSFVGTRKENLTICLKPMNHFDRYGVVVINDNHKVVSFQEKKYYEEGLINGGTYVVNVEKFLKAAPGEKFSFEKDFMERRFDQETIFGFVSSGYFIDIGIPEDYERAQQELKLV